MSDVVSLDLRMNGIVAKFADGTQAVGNLKVVDGVMTMVGFDAGQQSAILEFNQKIDRSALRDPRLDGLRCSDDDVIVVTDPVPNTGTGFDPVPFLARTIIIAVFDESLPYYSNGNGIPSTPEQVSNYYADKHEWDSLITTVMASTSVRVRFGMLYPMAGAQRSSVNTLRCNGCAWPGDTDNSRLLIRSYVSDALSPNRITATRLVNFFNTLATDYDPTFLLFVLDNSHSIDIDRDYGGPGSPNLVSAKEQILAAYPDIVILQDEIVDKDERWLHASADALRRVLEEGEL